MSTFRQILMVSLVTLVGFAGWGVEDTCLGETPARTDIAPGQQSGALHGRVIDESSDDRYVSPFTAAYLDRSMFHARTVGAGKAFATCVQNTMDVQYMNCTDPLKGADRSTQIGQAWFRYRMWGNSMSYGKRPSSDAPGADASARDETSDPYGTHHVTVYDGYEKDFGDWVWYSGVQPWNWRADTMVHEYMHTLGYNHADTLEAQQACAQANGRPSYYQFGEPSAPYIYGGCAYHVIDQSGKVCGDIHSGCPIGSLRLLSAWHGISTTQQDSTTSCTCVTDPRHVIALRTSSGMALTAVAGGGGELRTDLTARIGAWQWFYVYAPWSQGRGWDNYHPVYLKAFNGNFVRSVNDQFRADGRTPEMVHMGNDGLSLLGNNDVVQLGQLDKFAYDSGTVLRSAQTATDDRFRFRIIEPRRDHLIYLRTFHGRYVDTDTTGPLYVWNRLTEADIGGQDAKLQASAAFWVIDWNGGELENGDSISLEQFANDSYHYLTVQDGDHTGHARLIHSADMYELFQIHVTSGRTGRIQDQDEITLISANGTYLTAMPPDYFAAEIRNYGTYEGPWQRFVIRFVPQFDRKRSTW